MGRGSVLLQAHQGWCMRRVEVGESDGRRTESVDTLANAAKLMTPSRQSEVAEKDFVGGHVLECNPYGWCQCCSMDLPLLLLLFSVVRVVLGPSLVEKWPTARTATTTTCYRPRWNQTEAEVPP